MKDYVPSEFHLSQNYPNPFRDKTIIKYCIPYLTKVNISVIDAEGRLVKTLVESLRDAGTYEIEFERGSMPDGDYGLRIRAGDYVRIKRMTLLK